jgi:hypothetical protein
MQFLGYSDVRFMKILIHLLLATCLLVPTNAATKPNIVAKLKSLVEKMNADFEANDSSARRPAGKVKNPQNLYSFEEKVAVRFKNKIRFPKTQNR